MTLEQRTEEFVLRVQQEFNFYADGQKAVEKSNVLNDGATGKTYANITAERDTALQAAISSLLDGVPAEGNTLNKLYTLITGQANQNYATQAYVNSAIQSVVNAAPEALDTLKELADALNADPNFAATITNSLAAKANAADVYTKTESDAKYHTIADFNAKIGNPDVDLVALFEQGLL